MQNLNSFFLEGGVYYSLFYSYQLVFLSISNQYIENYAEQAGVYYTYNYVANLTFTKDLFLRNKAIKLNPDSIISNIYGGVFIVSGKFSHNVFVNFCEFTSNYADYEGN